LQTGKGIICGPKMRTTVRTLYPLPAQPMERKRMRLNSAYCGLLPSPRRCRR